MKLFKWNANAVFPIIKKISVKEKICHVQQTYHHFDSFQLL